MKLFWQISLTIAALWFFALGQVISAALSAIACFMINDHFGRMSRDRLKALFGVLLVTAVTGVLEI